MNQKMDILLNQTEEMETITIHFQKCSGLDPSVCSSVCPIQNKFSSSRYLQTGENEMKEMKFGTCITC